MKIIYRGFVLTLTVIMLLSVMCPVAALAEVDVTGDSNLAKTTETTAENKTIVEELSSENEEIAAHEYSSGESIEKQNEGEIISEPVIEQKAESSAAQENNTEPAAGTTEDSASRTADSNTQQKQEGTTAGIQAAAGATGKAAEGLISTGSLSAADGSTKSSRTKTNAELFVSAKGSDENGNGSFEAPFASIPAALNAARGMGVNAELCLLSNLSITGTVQILGMNVYLTSNEGTYTITRDDAFSLGEGGQDAAMFAIGSPGQENSSGGQLILEHIVLNEKGMKTEPVQEGMIAVYSGGKLILSEESMLLNYGGKSAVYAGTGSEVTVSATGWILDDMVFEEDGTVAIREDEGSTVIREAGCIVLSHGETYENVYGNASGEAEKTLVACNVNNSTEGNEDGSNNTGRETAEGNPDQNSDEFSYKPDEGADANLIPGAGILSKSVSPANSLLAEPGILNASGSLSSETSVLEIKAPDSISSSDVGTIKTIPSSPTIATGYEIPYQISLNAGNILGTFLPETVLNFAAQGLETMDISMTITLANTQSISAVPFPQTIVEGNTSVDLKLTPETGLLKVTSAIYDPEKHTIAVELGLGNGSISELYNTVYLDMITVFPSADYAAHIGETVSSTVTVDNVSGSTTINDYSFNRAVSNISSSKDTKMLGPKTTTLTYDPLSGTGGPGNVNVAQQENCPLEEDNVPTHADAGISGETSPVLFYGWTEEPDSTIYASGDTAPTTLKSVDVGQNAVTVYAVYSYDTNKDGKPDVDQTLLTLYFDANGGSGAPDPIVVDAKQGKNLSIDIPQKEPTRKHYTFLGWSEDENATEGEYKYNAERRTKRDITIFEDTCLYAVWQESPVYTLYFNGNGGTNVPAAQSARSNNGVAELTITKKTPTRSGRTFVGWSTQRYGTAAFEPGEAVRLTGGDVTLFAVWERNGSSSGRAPKTGDESNVPMYTALGAGSAAALFAVIQVFKKRRRKLQGNL